MRGTRWFASWKLWLALLFVGLALIVVAVCIPTYERMRAIRFLEGQDVYIEFAPGDEWLTERFGEVGTALRSVRWIRCEDEFSDRVLRRVALLDEVKEFELDGFANEPLTADGIASLASLTQLEKLSLRGPIEGVAGEDVFATFFAARPPLSEVHIHDAPLSADALVELFQIESLVTVNVRVERLTREDFQALHPLPQLKNLRLTFDGEIDVGRLRSSPRLSWLYLAGPLSDEDLRLISELSSLTMLNLAHCTVREDLTESGVAHITRLTHLKEIGLPAECITPDSIEMLARMPNLEEVYIAGDVERGLIIALHERWVVHSWNGYFYRVIGPQHLAN